MDKTPNINDMLNEMSTHFKEKSKNYVFMGDIKYPLTIEGVNIREPLSKDKFPPGQLVKVRLTKDDKTYLGVYLGELPRSFLYEYNKKNKKLEFLPITNPTILVPKLNKIVYGDTSWWAPIKDKSELTDITDKDIEDTWYVQVFRTMQESENDNSK